MNLKRLADIINPKILVIEDDIHTQTLVKMLLEKNHYQVVVADCAQDAMARLREMAPHLVITDYELPDHNGTTITRYLHKARPDLPIIGYSSTNDSEIPGKFLKNGAFIFLRKPINFLELLHIIQQKLGI